MSKDDKSDEVPRIVLADDAGAEVIDFLDSLNRHLTKDETSADEREIEKILGSSTNLPALTGPSPVPEAEPKAPVQQDEVKPELSKEEIEAQKAKLLKEARATFTNTNLPRIEPAASTSYEKTSGFFIKNLPLLGALYVAVIVAAVSLDGVRAFAHDKTAAAQIYNENGQYQEALKEAYLASRWNFLSAEAFREKGKALNHLLRLSEAEIAFNTALLLNANDTEALAARAALCVKIGKPDQTIADTNKLLSLVQDPSQLSAYYFGNRAVAYFRKGNYKAALADYDEALKMEPINYGLQLSKAFCLAADGQYKAAYEMCDFLLKLYPENDQVLCERGFCLQAMGKPQEAMRDFNKAIARDDQTGRWFVYRGGLERCLGQIKEATADYVRAANLDTAEDSIQYTAGSLLKQQGEFAQALVFYNRLADLPHYKKSFERQSERGHLLAISGNFKEALKDLQGALKIKFDLPTQIDKALCQAHLGMINEAEVSLDEAEKQAPKSAAVLEARAEAAQLAGNSISAIDYLTAVLDQDENNKAALQARAKLYMARKQWHSAADDLKAALNLAPNQSQSLQKQLEICRNAINSKAHTSAIACTKLPDLSHIPNEKLASQGYKLFSAGDSLASCYFTELARREPTAVQWRRYLAYSLELADEHQAAIDCFNKMAQVGALSLQDKLCMARALSASGQHSQALSSIQNLADSGDCRVKLEYARILSAAGQDQKAVEVCNQALASASGQTARELNNLRQSLHQSQERLRHKNEEDKDGKDNKDNHEAKPETEG